MVSEAEKERIKRLVRDTDKVRTYANRILRQIGLQENIVDKSEMEFPERYERKLAERTIDFMLHEEIDGIHHMLLHVNASGKFWISHCYSPVVMILHNAEERRTIYGTRAPVPKSCSLFTREVYFDCKRKLMLKIG